MKKFVWLIAFISLFAVGQVMVSVSEAVTLADGTEVAVDDNASLVVLNGEGAVSLNTQVLGSNILYEYVAVSPDATSDPTGNFRTANGTIATELMKNRTATTINLDAIATSKSIPAGTYAVVVKGNGKNGLITYFKLPTGVTKLVP